jgi:hypothetical protein
MLKESSLYKIEEDHRSSLYYAQYEWCITINISEAPCLRYLDSKKFEQALRNAKHWSEQDRFGENFRAWSPTKETALRETRDVLLTETEPYRTVVSFGTVSVYTNHVDIADRLINLGNDGVRLRLVRRALMDKPAGVVQLRESQYAYRTYLRERKYTKDQRDMLANFLHSRQDTLRVSPALASWANGTFIGYTRNLSYSRSYYFVDHDHPNEGTMLSLVMPGIVRKTMPIETTK